MKGTPAYRAPELMSGAGQYSTASDLWALGCVLYECAAGRPPFVAESAERLAHYIVQEDVPPISGTLEATQIEEACAMAVRIRHA